MEKNKENTKNIAFWEMALNKPLTVRFIKKTKEWFKGEKTFLSYFVEISGKTNFFTINSQTMSNVEGKSAVDLINENLGKTITISRVLKDNVVIFNIVDKVNNNSNKKRDYTPSIKKTDKVEIITIKEDDDIIYTTNEEKLIKDFLVSLNKDVFDNLENWLLFEQITKQQVLANRLYVLFENRYKEWIVK